MSTIFAVILTLLGLQHVQHRVDLTWSTGRGVAGIGFPYSIDHPAPSLDAAKAELDAAVRGEGRPTRDFDGNPISARELISGRIYRVVIRFGEAIEQEDVVVYEAPRPRMTELRDLFASPDGARCWGAPWDSFTGRGSAGPLMLTAAGIANGRAIQCGRGSSARCDTGECRLLGVLGEYDDGDVVWVPAPQIKGAAP